jgi:N-acetyl-anhydromuramyl-L-alanine amidase AmpD
MTETGIRTPGFVARPARSEIVEGSVQNRRLWQYDFTEEQYRALARLVATLAAVFPKIRLEVPRNGDGSLRTVVLEPDEWAAFGGLLGHYHVQTNKIDPGPAFDWERVLREAGPVR